MSTDQIRDSTEAIIAERIKAALEAEPGSATALVLAQEAILLSVLGTMKALKPALAPLMSPAHVEGAAAIRNKWIAKLRFINGCLAFPNLSGLSLALHELDRGVTAEALRPNGTMQGGKSNTERLSLMAYVVDAADKIKERCVIKDKKNGDEEEKEYCPMKEEVYRAILKSCGTANSTVESYRKAVHPYPELKPRLCWWLFGYESPTHALKEVVIEIKKLDKAAEPQSRKAAEPQSRKAAKPQSRKAARIRASAKTGDKEAR